MEYNSTFIHSHVYIYLKMQAAPRISSKEEKTLKKQDKFIRFRYVMSHGHILASLPFAFKCDSKEIPKELKMDNTCKFTLCIQMRLERNSKRTKNGHILSYQNCLLECFKY